jgi:SAM-dependent methyltransferase
VADVGCGPGAILSLLADAVRPDGTAIGIDQDPDAVAVAAKAVGDRSQALVQVGAADATGLRESAFDVVMCRHVLAHNGGREAAIVGHLASLVRPGGAVYLVDVDMAGLRIVPADPDLDIDAHYRAFHAQRGNDLSIGLRLGELLEAAGMDVERYRCVSTVLRLPPGVRGPHWAARQAMVDQGIASGADLDRWESAFTRMDQVSRRPWTFVPAFVAIGRLPAG